MPHEPNHALFPTPPHQTVLAVLPHTAFGMGSGSLILMFFAVRRDTNILWENHLDFQILVIIKLLKSQVFSNMFHLVFFRHIIHIKNFTSLSYENFFSPFSCGQVFASFLQPPSSPFGNGDLVDAALQSLCFAMFSQHLCVLGGELLLFI